ncbi:MAG: PepSY-associated TM helix domain-containing protein, partial [Comamonas sp.]|uniref:PepSY-associated TM helix domain-containing protein n=1 Tax=Comamonas sp. TaxID=34028 RepID=UPI002FC7767F
MAWLHAWLGLLLGGLLYFMFVTGTLGYLDSAIDRWMRPELPAARYPLPPEPALRQAQAFLQTHAHEARRWSITLPIDRNEPYLRVAWQGEAGSGAAYLDPGSGHQIATRATGGGQTLYQLHWRLHYLPARASEWIVGLASFVLLIALVTGVIVHRRIFADFFTFRPGKGQRSWLDAHNLAGVVSLPFQLMITYSGLVFVMFTLMPLIPAAWYGAGNSGQQAFLNEVFPPLAPAQAARRRAALAPLEQLLPDVRAQWGAAPV